jgi:hypothetical protein
MFGQIVIWIIFIGLGLAAVYYSGPISQVIGRSARADAHLWGTRNAVILFGFIVMIIWVLFACGVFKSASPMDVDSAF